DHVRRTDRPATWPSSGPACSGELHRILAPVDVEYLAALDREKALRAWPTDGDEADGQGIALQLVDSRADLRPSRVIAQEIDRPGDSGGVEHDLLRRPALAVRAPLEDETVGAGGNAISRLAAVLRDDHLDRHLLLDAVG